MVKFFSRFLNQLILLPSIIIFVITAASVMTNISTWSSASQNQMLVNYVRVSMDLVHELKKERGMSAGFLGSGGNNFRSELSNQRKLSDQRFADFKRFVQQGDGQELGSDKMGLAKGIIR